MALGIILLLSSLLAPASEAKSKTVSLGSIPAVFEPNRGQAAPEVRYLSRGPRTSLYLREDAVVVAMPALGDSIEIAPRQSASRPRLEGMGLLEGVSHYLRGEEASHWVRGIPHYSRVRYESAFPGIDVFFYGTNNELEFDVVLSPRANLAHVKFDVRGAHKLRRNRDGSLSLYTGRGELRLGKPIAYQPTLQGQRPVDCAFALDRDNSFGFRVGNYDPSLPLVIDPTLITTYLGGNDADIIAGVALDSSENIYITGFTASTNLLTAGGPYKGTLTAGDSDAFVMKLNPTATAVIYSTYVGGTFADYGRAIAVDSAGEAFITGSTVGRFPTTAGAFRTSPANAPAIFVACLSASGGSLAYSTYLDGAGAGQAIAVDASGNAYVAGNTYTATFTTTMGAAQQTYGGATDAFVVKLNPTGAIQLYSTFLGGSAEDQITGIQIDANGNAYVSGFTSSSNFPVTTGSFRTSFAGSTDAFVAKLNPTGATLVYSTFLGGANVDRAYSIAVSAFGEAYITGQTYSSSFPTTTGAYRTSHGGAADAFVTRLSADGSSAVFSTFLGGSGTCSVTDPFRLYQCDAGYAIALDSAGTVYVAGLAGASFPMVGGIQTTPGGNGDAFVAQLSANGASLLFSSYLGGGSGDVALALAVTPNNGPIIAGFTNSTDLPVTTGALQTTRGGGAQEGFLARLAPCAVTLGSTGSFFPKTAGTYNLAVFSSSNCAWSASTDVNWVTINTGGGTGNGQVNYTVAANTGPLRVGHIVVSGQTYTIQQVTGICATPASTGSWHPASVGLYSFTVFGTCPWTATTPNSWVNVATPTGTGDGNVFYFVLENTTGSARYGSIDVNGQTYAVNQVGGAGSLSCTYFVSSSSETFPRAGGSSSVLVLASTGCEWIVSNPNSWITLTAGPAGSADGVVGYTVAPNDTGQTRVGVMVIAGSTFTVTQSGQ
ncbi:MAG: SBBP repeat-containing protein [Bryobacteraceae bacterium]